MRRVFKLSSSVLVGFLLLGCGSGFDSTQIRWSSQSGSSSEQIPDEVRSAIAQAKPVASLSKSQVFRGQQRVGPATIQGSWIQVMKDHQGEVSYVGAEVFPEPPPGVRDLLTEMDKNKEKLLAQAKQSIIGLKNAHSTSDPKVILQKGFFGFKPLVAVEYVNAQQTDAIELLINQSGRVVSSRSVAFHLADGVATVFPGNPKITNLSEEILYDLAGNGTLVSRLLQLESALEQTPFNPNNYFRYTPDEPMFNDVQAFYFADQTIRWFEKELTLKLNEPLHVRVHIGGITPSNAAFYYRGRVRLGDGDGKVYQGIPRDPSIVGHEVSHAFVEMVSGLPFEGEGGSYSEGFADFFTACFRDNPKMGEYAYVKDSYKRTIENDQRADLHLNGGLYNDSLIVSGTFWELREQLGEEKALKLALGFLSRVGAGGTFADFVPVMQDVVAAELSNEEAVIAHEVLRRRGWLDLTLKGVES